VVSALKRKTWFIKLTNSEYWPVWVYYLPVWIQHFWLALRVRNLYFFLRTNPAIEGFILSDSKSKTLQLVPEQYRPRSLLWPGQAPLDFLGEELASASMKFPIILKPDIGFRGIKVHKVTHREQLEALLRDSKIPLMLQEYCEGPLEVGIFYYRFPGDTHGCIPSITLKEPLLVTGDGRATLQELILREPRAILQMKKLREKFEGHWHDIPAEGVQIVLETIGNHNRGSKFVNGTHLADRVLLEIFDSLSHQMKGFYFGRFDIKTASWEALRDRRDFKILEVNGVGGEPTHIYDPRTSLFRAWKDLCFTWKVASRIAQINFSHGFGRPTYLEARTRWRSYVAYRAALFT
jgi:hypothetical protein